MNVAEPGQIRERKLLSQSGSIHVADSRKKKSGSASTFFRGNEKKMGGQASRLSPGFYSILEIRYLTRASKASRRSIAPRVRPFFLAQNLKYQASKKHLAWSMMPDSWCLFKRVILFKIKKRKYIKRGQPRRLSSVIKFVKFV